MKLYFVRHGESEANLPHEISNRGWKHGLTEKGRRQSQELAQALAGAGIRKIYTSPLKRAVETAHILALALGTPVEVTDALREYDCGVIEGRSDEESWRQHRQLRQAWLEGHQRQQRIEGGESFLDIQARFLPLIERLLADPPPDGGSLALVGHGGTYFCMLPLVLHNLDFEFAGQQDFPNTAYVLAETTPSGLVCREWCGVRPEN